MENLKESFIKEIIHTIIIQITGAYVPEITALEQQGNNSENSLEKFQFFFDLSIHSC